MVTICHILYGLYPTTEVVGISPDFFLTESALITNDLRLHEIVKDSRPTAFPIVSSDTPRLL